jgi:SAM-dependent methyltransferase
MTIVPCVATGPQPSAYDTLGWGYDRHRRPEPAISRLILAALEDSASVLDVGAGTGSYEPRDRTVVAVEPSAVMIAQRAPDAAPVVRGVAEALPVRDGAFDAAMALLTVHHWSDFGGGMRELRRVARRRIVVLTWDPGVLWERFWFVRDYVPVVREMERDLPTLDHVRDALAESTVEPVPIPHECSDGFFGAYWRRPDAYLDPGVRASISALARLDEATVRQVSERLAADLRSGAWDRRYGDLRALEEIDLGYRLVVARLS